MKACYFMSCFFHVEFVRFPGQVFCGISLCIHFDRQEWVLWNAMLVVQCRMVLYADTWYTACKTQLETLRLFRGLMLCGKDSLFGLKVVCLHSFVCASSTRNHFGFRCRRRWDGHWAIPWLRESRCNDFQKKTYSACKEPCGSVKHNVHVLCASKFHIVMHCVVRGGCSLLHIPFFWSLAEAAWKIWTA